jgi:hypothetical protein
VTSLFKRRRVFSHDKIRNGDTGTGSFNNQQRKLQRIGNYGREVSISFGCCTWCFLHNTETLINPAAFIVVIVIIIIVVVVAICP